jgi:non-specific protein-tyrosine kinase
LDDIRRQAFIALRWLPLVVVAAIAAAGIAYALMAGQPKIFQSTATLQVYPGPNPSTTDIEAAAEQLRLMANDAEAPEVAAAVIDKLELDAEPSGLSQGVNAVASKDDLTLKIDVRDADPATAQLLAKAIGDVMRERARANVTTDEVLFAERAMKSTRTLIQQSMARLEFLQGKRPRTARDNGEIIALQSQINTLNMSLLTYQAKSKEQLRNTLTWMDLPDTPSAPVEPRPIFWAALALLIGGMLALVFGFVIEYLQDKVRNARDVENATGLVTVGSISEKRGDIRSGDANRVTVLRHPGSATAEAYRNLRARITLEGNAVRTLLVASAATSDAKDTVAANLAVAFAESGRRVILVDGAYRNPRLHSFFGLQNELGLSTLVADLNAPLSYVTLATGHPDLRLLPAGPPPPAGVDLLAVPQLPDIIDMLLEVADMVIFDSPSMASSLDAVVLADHVQASLLVVPRGSRGDTAADATRLLEATETHLVGAALYRTVRGSHRREPVRRSVIPVPRTRALARVRQPDVTPQAAGQAASPYLFEAIMYRGILGSPAPADGTLAPGSPGGPTIKAVGPPRADPQTDAPGSTSSAAQSRAAAGQSPPGQVRAPYVVPVAPATPPDASRPSVGPFALQDTAAPGRSTGGTRGA